MNRLLVPYHLSEIEHQSCESLSEYKEYLPPASSQPEAIFDTLWSMAKAIWPEDTAKAEAWVKQEAMRYGIAEGKAQAVQISQSSITWIVLGVVAGLFLTRKKR
jgi:hypothetical protein